MQGACVICTAPPLHLQGGGKTALHKAAEDGHLEMVKALVAGGCSLDVKYVSVFCMCVCVCVCLCVTICISIKRRERGIHIYIGLYIYIHA
jgi:hypothetical protein